MATNMALDSVTTTSITVHGWYGGTTPVYYGKMYCNGSLFANNYSAAGSTNWTLPSVAKLNLEPDTQYGFTCVFYAANNTTVIESSSTFYWKTDPLPDLPSPTLQSYTKTATSVSVTLAIIYPSGSTYHAELNGSSQTSSDRYFTFSRLQPNTTYTLSTYASKSGYNNSTISTANVTTDNLGTLSTPSIISQSVTKTSISITLSDVGADTYYASKDGGSYQSGSGRSFIFTGLTSGQTYAIRYKATKSGYNDSAVGGPTSITTATNLKPDPWSWTASNGSASSAQTQAAYNAVIKTAGYDLTDFSYLVWNDLLDKIDEFCTYKSASAVNAGAFMSSGDKALSATKFNYALAAVNAMSSTGITSRSAGDLVYGAYFTTITSTINGIT